MAAAREILLQNVAMLELLDSNFTSHHDHEIAMTMIDAYNDQMGEAPFSNLCERLKTSEIVCRLRKERDEGKILDIENVLDELQNVFKQGDYDDEPTLESALLASGPIRAACQQPDVHQRPVRTTTGGASSVGWRKAEVVTIQGSEDTQKVLNLILKGMNDIKSELGSFKKLIQPSETSKPNAVQFQGKPGWRSNEQDGKPEKRTKFANVAEVQPRRATKFTSAPQPLQTSRVTQMYSSDESDEQEANFAGAMLSKSIASRFNFRILTAHHNETELGRRKCTKTRTSFGSPQQGSKHGTPQFASLRLADTIQKMDHLHESLTTKSLSGYWAHESSEETMASIGGQMEVIKVPSIIERDESLVEKVGNKTQTYDPAATSIRSLEELTEMRRVYYGKTSPPPRATAVGIRPTLSTPPPPRMPSPDCRYPYPPSAPQVENYVPGTISAVIRNIQVENTEDDRIEAACDRVRTDFAQAKARNDNLIIPDPLEISDSDENEVANVKAPPKRSRSSKTLTARKIIITTPQGRGDPRTTLEYLDPRSARRQARASKLQPSDIETSTASINQAPSLRSTSTTSDLSTSGGVGQEEDSDRMPDLVNSSYETEDSGHSNK